MAIDPNRPAIESREKLPPPDAEKIDAQHRKPCRPECERTPTMADDEIAVCLARHHEWPATAWQTMLAARRRFEGSKMIIPRKVFDDVRAEWTDPAA